MPPRPLPRQVPPPRKKPLTVWEWLAGGTCVFLGFMAVRGFFLWVVG